MPRFPLETVKSTDSSLAIDRLHRPRGYPFPRNSRLIPPFSSIPLQSQDVLLLVFRRVRRTRGIRIMLPFSACLSVSVYYIPSLDIRRVIWTSSRISSWTHLLSGINIRFSCFGCQLRVFGCLQRNINTFDNGTSETGREVGAESRISPFDRAQYLSLRNHFMVHAVLQHSIFTQYFILCHHLYFQKQEKILE